MKKLRRRRSIEIYFILYLASLIFLIPDKNHEQKKASSLVQRLLASSFVVQSERAALLVRVVRDGSGVRILTADTVNALYHSGNVKNVRYEFIVEDVSLRQTYTLKSGTQTSVSRFTLKGNPDEGALRFAWSPNGAEQSNKVYKIKVVATAEPVIPADLTAEDISTMTELVGEGYRLRAEAEFGAALLFVDGGTSPAVALALNPQVLQATDTAAQRQIRELMAQLESARTQTSVPSGRFVLQPRYDVVKSIGYQEWENRIVVYGADVQRDLASAPVVTGGSASSSIEGNEIVLRGVAPQSGILTFQVTARRATDNQESSVTFKVVSQPLAAASVPSQMYPGIQYDIQPNLPLMSGTPAIAQLRDESNNIRASSVQGEAFTFTPQLADTSRTLYFERLLSGRKIGQAIPVQIINFPQPEILNTTTLPNGTIRIKTRSYGVANDNAARARLEITSGVPVGRVQEMYGDYTYDKQYNVHLQVFQLSPQKNVLTLRATNGYKKQSTSIKVEPD
ncbi:MAG: hypothetical protein JNL32_09075 [Candidatus Kapabacteria bacterium]|nr:hypothetical protein [Candidatus Kapabacteria bacterium]